MKVPVPRFRRGNGLGASGLIQRRMHGPHLENPGFGACHGIFRARRIVFVRDATDHRVDQQKADIRTNAGLDRLLAALSLAGAFCRAG